MIVVVMGVSGVGKSSVARRVAADLGLPFLEGDEFHSPEARAKTARAEPLTDEDRWPWLDRLNEELRRHPGGAVLACSALGERHRRRLLRDVEDVHLVHLTGDPDEIRERMAEREGASPGGAGPALLASQLAALEPPEDAITVDVGPPLAEVVRTVLERLAATGS